MTQTLPSAPEIDVAVFNDQARFRREIVEPCQPVILRGVCGDWPVVRAAVTSTEAIRAYLGRFANETAAEAFIGAPSIAGRYSYTDGLDGFNFERIEIDLPGALERILASAA